MYSQNTSAHSLEQLKSDASQIVFHLQNDPDFCRNAATNPVEALRKLGFKIDSPAIRRIEKRLSKSNTASA
ncbi:MAG: hypothetical protein KDC34_14720 [Saprospiraceae bacterium]|nr:hypothetical protein [Saprospiraceae bacterium]